MTHIYVIFLLLGKLLVTVLLDGHIPTLQSVLCERTSCFLVWCLHNFLKYVQCTHYSTNFTGSLQKDVPCMVPVGLVEPATPALAKAHYTNPNPVRVTLTLKTGYRYPKLLADIYLIRPI